MNGRECICVPACLYVCVLSQGLCTFAKFYWNTSDSDKDCTRLGYLERCYINRSILHKHIEVKGIKKVFNFFNSCPCVCGCEGINLCDCLSVCQCAISRFKYIGKLFLKHQQQQQGLYSPWLPWALLHKQEYHSQT